MEKNHIIGFILIFATLLLFNMMNAPSKEQLAERKRVQDSIAMAEQNPVDIDETTIEEQIPAIDTSEIALDSNVINTPIEEIVTLENDDIKVDFSTKGGFIKEVLLKKYKNSYHPDRELTKEEMLPIKLLADPNNVFYTILRSDSGGTMRTSKMNFTPQLKGNKLTMSANAPGIGDVKYIYELDSLYGLKYSIDATGIDISEPLDLHWSNYIPKLERGDFFEQRFSSIYYKMSDDDDADYCSCTSDDEEEMEGEKIDWISHSNQFFNAALISRSRPFAGGVQKTIMIDLDKGGNNLKRVESDLKLDFAGSNVYDMQMYLGPNDFDILKGYESGFEEIIPYGTSIFGSINRWVVRPFFNFLSKFSTSLGLVIILLIFIIKMLLYPLLYKMLYSQAKMAALKPELAHLKDKFKEEPQKIQTESMKIYQQYGVSPLSGCLPMVVQMPIWIALYRFFPANIDFRQVSFLWSNDLSSYDAFFQLPFEIPMMGSHLSLFTILWAITTLIYTFYNSRHLDMGANPAMKYAQYLMPLMFLGFFNTYASGLTAYMFFNNLINIFQIIITKNFIFDDEKIRKELMIQKSKPKKKSKFQTRMEEAMKQQQQVKSKRDQGKKKRK
jgi:YidC/Oxa1 family membrane protein insertase